MYIFAGCQHQTNIPDIESDKFPKYNTTIPITDSIIFKYPTKEFTIEKTIKVNNANTKKIIIKYYKNNLSTGFINSYKTVSGMDDTNTNYKVSCGNMIDLKNKKLLTNNCAVVGESITDKEFYNIEINNQIDIKSKIYSLNKSVKSGTIISSTNINDILKTDYLKNTILHEYIQGWGIYNNKNVIVTKIEVSEEGNLLDDWLNEKERGFLFKAFANTLLINKNKSYNIRIGGYNFYDPKTFIKVYSHTVMYFDLGNSNRISTYKEEVFTRVVN